MADNVRDRVLILRVLPQQLLHALRKKISATEEKVTSAAEHSKQEQNIYRNKHANELGILLPITPVATNAKEGQISDLEGVHCVPTENGSTLWEFSCDKKKYPARLVNLPCPVEVHKTYDHAMFYKCSDVGQMLIVYENMSALEDAEGMKDYKFEEFPSYFHSGLTPPMKRVVQRRFKAREHKNEPYRRDEVAEVMTALRDLILQIRPDASKGKSKSKYSSANSSSDASKVIEVIEDVEVSYESWMTNDGKTPAGIEFDETDALCYKHPELWMDPSEEAIMEEQERKKKAKKKKNKNLTSIAEEGKMGSMVTSDPSTLPTTSHKKGIASKKNRGTNVDEVTQAALSIRNNTEDDDLALMFGDEFDFDGDDPLNFD